MEVKIYLDAERFADPAQFAGKSAFAKEFDKVSQEFLEPECPFCGTRLKDAFCRCKKFGAAVQKLLAAYDNSNLYVGRDGNMIVRCCFAAEAVTVTMTRVALSEDILKLFDEGTTARGRKSFWFVSKGLSEGRKLSFFLRGKGESSVFLCETENVPYVVPQPEVTVCRCVRDFVSCGSVSGKPVMGRYRIEHRQQEIDKFGYEEFFERLRKNS